MSNQSLADHHHARRMNRCMAVRTMIPAAADVTTDPPVRRLPPVPPSLATSQQQPQDDPAHLEEAERLKSFGNAHMQKKEYEAAAQSYT